MHMHFHADNKTHEVLESRRDQYRHAALAAKKAGDLVTATKYVKTAKVCTFCFYFRQLYVFQVFRTPVFIKTIWF